MDPPVLDHSAVRQGLLPLPRADRSVQWPDDDHKHRSQRGNDLQDNRECRRYGWTNLKTGKQLTYNISDPGTVVVNPDGSFSAHAGGANLLWTTVANSYPGVPQLAYTTGHVQFTVDASGKTTSYSLSGSSTDVCAALA
jgi:hypothetical protein